MKVKDLDSSFEKVCVDEINAGYADLSSP